MDVLTEGFGRLPALVHGVVDGLSADQLRWTPGPAANPIGWLVWHLTRVQDDHIAEVAGTGQVWAEGPWAAGFELAPDPANTGYEHSAAEVAAVRPTGPAALTGYFDAVAAVTADFLAGLKAADLDRVVDRRWDPPVTLGARLVSVLADDLQHVGQAGYLRGLLP